VADDSHIFQANQQDRQKKAEPFQQEIARWMEEKAAVLRRRLHPAPLLDEPVMSAGTPQEDAEPRRWGQCGRAV